MGPFAMDDDNFLLGTANSHSHSRTPFVEDAHAFFVKMKKLNRRTDRCCVLPLAIYIYFERDLLLATCL